MLAAHDLAMESSAALETFGSGSFACWYHFVSTKFRHWLSVTGMSKAYSEKALRRYLSAATLGAGVDLVPSSTVFCIHA